MNTPAMIIDFEATDVSKEAEATQLGLTEVYFNTENRIFSRQPICGFSGNILPFESFYCKPDRAISYGAMAISHITSDQLKGAPNHKDIVTDFLPKGEAYIIGHNVDYDIQVAANAGVDVSQYKRICTQALARKLLTDTDSHSLGALMYFIYPDRARQYCRNAHDAGWDVTFTLWLLEHLCELGNIDSMEHLYAASEIARIPTAFTFGKYYGRKITEVAFENPGYLRWVIEKHDNTYLIEACKNVLASKGVSHGR